MDEQQVRQSLYGERNGHVTLTPLFPDEYGRVAGLSKEWIEWDRITWPFQKQHSVAV